MEYFIYFDSGENKGKYFKHPYMSGLTTDIFKAARVSKEMHKEYCELSYDDPKPVLIRVELPVFQPAKRRIKI